MFNQSSFNNSAVSSASGAADGQPVGGGFPKVTRTGSESPNAVSEAGSGSPKSVRESFVSLYRLGRSAFTGGQSDTIRTIWYPPDMSVVSEPKPSTKAYFNGLWYTLDYNSNTLRSTAAAANSSLGMFSAKQKSGKRPALVTALKVWMGCEADIDFDNLLATIYFVVRYNPIGDGHYDPPSDVPVRVRAAKVKILSEESREAFGEDCKMVIETLTQKYIRIEPPTAIHANKLKEDLKVRREFLLGLIGANTKGSSNNEVQSTVDIMRSEADVLDRLKVYAGKPQIEQLYVPLDNRRDATVKEDSEGERNDGLMLEVSSGPK
ncbi:hypothetical protein QFC21_005109 [Naganishia friedmannii]|uniref:Uncharacterized protein n=1 Tax=Naganishia friedmannii TaxID=89922 RepID=A0ACC2VCI4_9TREE|nr:hypothetical protein QFC21_005109 [Naganishia friedmannii]